jgi:hypothetical protein
MSRPFAALAAVVFVLASIAPASADVTAFLGISPTPETHTARGFAFGFGLLIVGFEFEYSNLTEDELELTPSLTTGSGNVLIQTPTPGVSVYGTIGAGGYREGLLDRTETQFCTNVGGGAKIRLVGPLRVRVDYRVFKLAGEPFHDVYHRFYVGANLAF